MFHKERKGVSTLVLVGVIVVIVAIAGVGAYYALTLSNTSSTSQTTSSSSQSSTLSSYSSTQQSQSQTTTSSSTTSSQSTSSQSTTTSDNAALYAISSTKNLFGNFSQMTMMFSSENKSSGLVDNATWSFHVIGKATINGSQLTVVNYTISYAGQSEGNYSAVVYFDSGWNVTMINMNGLNYTGMMADAFIAPFSAMFTSFFSYQQEYAANPALFSQFVQVSTDSQNFGGLSMQVTTYAASNIVTSNATVQSASLGIGQVPNTNFSILTFFHIDESVGTQQSSYTIALISATKT